MKLIKILLIAIVLVFSAKLSMAQSSADLGSAIYQKIGVHSGNLVKTVFTNAGVIGQPSTGGPRGAWIYDNNGYIGDISLLVGAEVRMNERTNFNNQIIRNLISSNGDSVYHSVVISDVNRPSQAQEIDPLGNSYSFQPKPEYAERNQNSIAISTNRGSWPETWPDKADDSEDPGWRGSFNSYFGKASRADQESYFVMDDNADYEFNFDASNPNLNVYNHIADANNLDRKGLGLDVSVRGMQWSQFLASDVIFWLYGVTNAGTNDYARAVLGLLCGTYVGVTGTDDSPQEFDDDISFFDVRNNLVYSWDYPQENNRNPNWRPTPTSPVGFVGYAFMESPGNPFDGIDNDNDSELREVVFQESDFDSLRVVSTGDQLVVITQKTVVVPGYTEPRTIYERSLVTLPAQGIAIKTLGMRSAQMIMPGDTLETEGNLIEVPVVGQPGQTEEVVNPNAYDGIDNDFDGLIDENINVHFRQLKKDQDGNEIFNIEAPVAYINYITGQGLGDPLIDEDRDDGIDNDGDWDPEFDDVGRDGVFGTNDSGEGNGIPDDGEPNFDRLDVDESDQIGLTSFEYFTPSDDINLRDDEDLWTRLQPGFFTVPENAFGTITTEDYENPERVVEKGQQGEDGDFTFGSGYFPLLQGKNVQFSFALVYGSDITDFYRNRAVAQDIYNSNYQFPQAPDKPVVKAVADDGKVTLYWGRESETSLDPVLRIQDFEGYKIYKSRDSNFEDIRIVTDVTGNAVGYKALAQFDIPNNGVKDLYVPRPDLYQQAQGFAFYLGDDVTGLAHKYEDNDVVNGLRYFYAVVSYDRGDSEKGIFPSENTRFILINSAGQIETDDNTVVAYPQPRAAGYLVESSFPITQVQGQTNSTVATIVVDDSRLVDNAQYRVTFNDQANDDIDNDNDGLLDTDDFSELIPVTTSYSVKKLTAVSESFSGFDTSGFYQLQGFGEFVDSADVEIREGMAIIDPSKYIVREQFGRIRAREGSDFVFDKNKIYTVTFSPTMVYRSPYIPLNPNLQETKGRTDSDDLVFDGMTLEINNYWRGAVLRDSTVQEGSDDLLIDASVWNAEVTNIYKLEGRGLPYNYSLEFFDDIVDTSYDGSGLFILGALLSPKPVKFKVKNKTLDKYSEIFFIDNFKKGGELGYGDQVIILEPAPKDYNDFSARPRIFRNSPDGKYLFTYSLNVLSTSLPANTDTTFSPGDYWEMKTSKPLNSNDVFEFTVKAGSIPSAQVVKEQMDDIYPVPNPYIGGNQFEPPLPPNVTSGRGERVIEFRNTPNDATVYIFTSAGELIRTLTTDGSLLSGTIRWNLKTRENLDVAPGVYFYIVKSQYGQKEGKLAIIK